MGLPLGTHIHRGGNELIHMGSLESRHIDERDFSQLCQYQPPNLGEQRRLSIDLVHRGNDGQSSFLQQLDYRQLLRPRRPPGIHHVENRVGIIQRPVNHILQIQIELFLRTVIPRSVEKHRLPRRSIHNPPNRVPSGLRIRRRDSRLLSAHSVQQSGFSRRRTPHDGDESAFHFN